MVPPKTELGGELHRLETGVQEEIKAVQTELSTREQATSDVNARQQLMLIRAKIEAEAATRGDVSKAIEDAQATLVYSADEQVRVLNDRLLRLQGMLKAAPTPGEAGIHAAVGGAGYAKDMVVGAYDHTVGKAPEAYQPALKFGLAAAGAWLVGRMRWVGRTGRGMLNGLALMLASIGGVLGIGAISEKKETPQATGPNQPQPSPSDQPTPATDPTAAVDRRRPAHTAPAESRETLVA
jgi:hypothetical protein